MATTKRELWLKGWRMWCLGYPINECGCYLVESGWRACDHYAANYCDFWQRAEPAAETLCPFSP